jgi:RNA polymerase sigma factor (sigma-70 family)
MQELDDIGLLREYVERGSEEAFAALVERHINKVYSVALRHTGNPHQAEEVTQAVFVILARKSRQLSRGAILYSWLYKTARLAAAAFIRGEVRRTRREQEAWMANLNEPSEPEVWSQIAPLLDAALAALNETDRRALVLRFFYGKTMKEIGADLGANENATKKRVDRALDKLQDYFSRRGVHSTTTMLAGTISACSVQIAPAALAKTVTAVALAKGATVSTSTLTLIKGALKIMAWTKAKSATVAVVAAFLAAGTTTIVIKSGVFGGGHSEDTQAKLNRSPGIYSNGINDAHRIPNPIYTYPDGDETTHQYVINMVKMFRKELDPAQVVKSDRELTEEDIHTRTIYIYGSPENHTFFQGVRDQLPIVFESDGVVVGDKKCLGRDVGAIFVCPNPLNPKNRLVVYGTVSPDALREMNAVYHGPTDYIVFNNTTRRFRGVSSPDQFLLLGSFDKSDPNNWRVDDALQVLPTKVLQRATAKVVVAE